MGNCLSRLGRTIRNDRQEEPPVHIPLRQNRSSPLRTRKESIRSIEEDPGDEPIPSTSSEHQSSTPQTHEGEVSSVNVCLSVTFFSALFRPLIMDRLGDGHFHHHHKHNAKQECILVGCVPPTCSPYLPSCTALGV